MLLASWVTMGSHNTLTLLLINHFQSLLIECFVFLCIFNEFLDFSLRQSILVLQYLDGVLVIRILLINSCHTEDAIAVNLEFYVNYCFACFLRSNVTDRKLAEFVILVYKFAFTFINDNISSSLVIINCHVFFFKLGRNLGVPFNHEAHDVVLSGNTKWKRSDVE